MKIRRSVYYLSILFCLLAGIGSGPLSALLSSCSVPAKNPVLLLADSLMETRPDSSLLLLDSIHSPQELPRGDRALYALLLTQARYKNYIVLEDDSLIRTAVDYYGDNKKSMLAARAHYYLGAAHRDMNHPSLAVDEFLKAIRLVPAANNFLAMIYDNLAECYEDDGLTDMAMDAYRSAHRILKGGDEEMYPLRGIANIFFMQNKIDSTLYYYQQAIDCALKAQNSVMAVILYHDYARVCIQEEDYSRADQYVSKALVASGEGKAVNSYLFKARIMLGLNQLDSADYYYNKCIDQQQQLDVYKKAICYDGIYKVAMKKGDWKKAAENADIYKTLYDSIQRITDNDELTRLMDKHQLEEHKRVLSEQNRLLIGTLSAVFLGTLVLCVFYFMWKDRKRKKHYIILQQELTQMRVETMLLNEAEVSGDNKEQIDRKRLELLEGQLRICISMFETTGCYNKLMAMKKATPKELLEMRVPSLRGEIHVEISKTFFDVIENLRKLYSLTHEDAYYCILSCLYCPKIIIADLMGVTLDALKSRKSRIKSKIDALFFDRVFGIDNQ